MSTKKYLLTLSGQGDTYHVLVSKTVWDWVFSPAPKFDKTNRCKEKMPAELVSNPSEDTCYITSGSWENDRALAVTGCHDGKFTMFSTKELMKYCSKNDIEIVDEYDGCIY